MFSTCLAPDTTGDGTGCDNMTCIIVRFDDKPEEKVGEKRNAEENSPETAETDMEVQEAKRQKIEEEETNIVDKEKSDESQ